MSRIGKIPNITGRLMRMIASSNSGAVQLRWLTATFLLFAMVGLAVFLLSHLTPHTSRIESSTGPLEVARTNLALEEGRWRQLGSASPFSGFMIEYYPDGLRRSRSAITNGLLHGLSQGWYTNAQIQVTEQFKDGVSHGLRTKWYPNGARQSEANIVEGKLNGTFRRWHENGTLAEQVEFVGGKPEGISIAYFPSGSLKARVAMKSGRLIEQEFCKDGEKKE